MRLYKRFYNRLALLDRRHTMKIEAPASIATFTFDDFPRSAYEAGGKILEAAGARATYFVTGSRMDRNIDGTAHYNEAILRAAHAAGHEIGCHTFDHKNLGSEDTAFARESCERNKAFIKNILEKDPRMTSFAYPYGDVSIAVKNEMARRFSSCRGVHQALNTEKVDMAQISIINLERRFADTIDLKSIISKAARKKSWIVFMSHDVSETPTSHGSTPDVIVNTVRLLKAANISILPMKEAINAVKRENTPQ